VIREENCSNGMSCSSQQCMGSYARAALALSSRAIQRAYATHRVESDVATHPRTEGKLELRRPPTLRSRPL
jgi:hypothetical protein